MFDEFVRGEGEGHDFELVGKLDKTAIDTGAGLERLAFIMQDKPNMYEIDEVYPVIAAAQEMSGKTYGRGAAGPSAGSAYDADVRMRVVADHVRSALMLINDGVRPGNDGRGYVLRRLIRRAVRSMRLLGVDEPALPTLLTASKEVMALSYPELNGNWATIQDVAYAEEEAFRRTLSAGTSILDLAVADAKASGSKVLDGASAFSLHDTYGFPIDLTLEMAAEQGLKVDEDAFKALMLEQKERARADARAKKTGHTDVRVFQEIGKRIGGASEFLGYTDLAARSRRGPSSPARRRGPRSTPSADPRSHARTRRPTWSTRAFAASSPRRRPRRVLRTRRRACASTSVTPRRSNPRSSTISRRS